MDEPVDVVIVGGGPAGLAAALVLGRARKRVIVLDDGAPRNAGSRGVHGFLGHDGVPPAELRRIGREQLERYPSVELRAARAVSLDRAAGSRISVALASGAPIECARALLACGLIDSLPKIPGLGEAWGRSAFSCPFCHGWEHRDRPWGALALQKAFLKSIPLARAWTSDVVLLANGRTDLDPAALAELERKGIRIEPRAIESFAVTDGEVSAAVLVGGAAIPLGGIWLHPGNRHADIVLYAGLLLDGEGLIKIGAEHETSMRGVHACGDIAAGAAPDAIHAAASGSAAAVDLVALLTK